MSPPASIPEVTFRDRWAMQEALALALQSIGLSEPNPRVGCVITNEDGRVLGRGFTQRAGEAHAEVMALRDAAARGHSVRGATAYVTLEPCAHHGRTPPCCDALVHAGLGRVVAALQDPNPQVAGKGIQRLRAAGIRVSVGLLADEAREVNIGFFSRMQRGRPWVRLKAAISLDGRTALPHGASQWITSEAARIDGHAWRKRSGAVLTGVGTVLGDDPRMEVWRVETVVPPLRVIVDSRLRTPPAARLLDMPGRALIYTAIDAPELAGPLLGRGADLCMKPSPEGRVSLADVLTDLARRGINELHVEAGAVLNGALLQEGLVDECLIYVATAFLGDGLTLAQLGPFSETAEALRFRMYEATQVGGDLRLLARLVDPNG